MSETQSLGGRYDLGDVIGRGGMAEVRRGIDTRLGRTVAIKMLRVDHATDPTFQARFRREAQSAASLNHRNIVAVYDTGEDEMNGSRVPFIVMEYVEGKTLREMMQEGQRLTQERAGEITSGILDALEYSHRAGIVHRDIKPGNVMLTGTGEVKVMDFGIARSLAETGAALTQTAAVVGTAQYISPEQARGESADARSDLYATGCVLYELLTGRPPFVGESLVSVAVSHVREIPTPPSELQPSVSPDMDAVVMHSLAKDRMDRYQSAYDMRADLDRAVAGLPVVAVAETSAATQLVAPVADDATPMPEDEEEGSGARWWAVILAALAVLVVAGIVAFVITRPDGGDAVPVPDLVGAELSSVEAQLQEAGLQLGQQEAVETEDEPPNTVLSQNPSAGDEVEEGTVVAIEYAVEPGDITVPADLEGSTQADAEAAISDAGLTVGEVSEQESGDVDPGIVLEASPSSGTSVAPDTAIDLVVAIEVQAVSVPNVVGQDVDAARSTLEAEGFTIGSIDEVASPEDADQVLATEPSAGVEVDPGTEIDLQVSNGEAQVPDVVGSSAATAEAVLRQAGFDVEITEEETADANENEVIDQSPGPGDTLPSGEVVTITVAVAPPEPDTGTENGGGDADGGNADGGADGGQDGGGQDGGTDGGGAGANGTEADGDDPPTEDPGADGEPTEDPGVDGEPTDDPGADAEG